jgi:type IV secretion system protein VirB9
MTTDVELEPGERVNNVFISDPKRWSMSAAWSGQIEEADAASSGGLVTHVLLRTSFPGLKADLIIHTDRRTYMMEFRSALEGPHIPYIGFDYSPERGPAELLDPEPIPDGPWRDLLVTYNILSADKEPEAAARKRLDRVEGAEVNFRYSIKPVNASDKIAWAPTSVYDAGGATYIVLPKEKKKGKKTLPDPGSHSLLVTRKNKRLPATYKVVRNDLYMVDTLFDEAFLTFGGKEVVIRRLPNSTR